MMLFNNLPNEVISGIVEHLEGDSLRTFCLTSTRFNALAEPVLYRQILLRKGQECIEFLKSVNAREGRASAIHSIDARCLYGHQNGLDHIATLLRRAGNLHELTIESPVCNYQHWRYDYNWKHLMASLLEPLVEAVPGNPATQSFGALNERPLRTLKKLTLHLNGDRSRHWAVDSAFAAIFMHPTLESLTISCAEILGKDFESFDHQPKTPLKHLTMIECFISHSGLRKVLSMPNALKSLYLGDVCSYAITYGEEHEAMDRLLEKDCAKFFAALAQQKNSLEELEYWPRVVDFSNESLIRWSSMLAECGGFSEFERLRSVSVHARCPLLMGALVDKSLTPPNLEAVRFLVDAVDDYAILSNTLKLDAAKTMEEWALRSYLRQLCDHLSILEKLEELTVVTRSNYDNLNNDRYCCLIETASKAFKPDRVRFSTVERTETRYFPPYLYGEKPPVETTIFDTSSGGWQVERKESGQTANLPVPPDAWTAEYLQGWISNNSDEV